jgi:replication-associated recombination protein RarA
MAGDDQYINLGASQSVARRLASQAGEDVGAAEIFRRAGEGDALA